MYTVCKDASGEYYREWTDDPYNDEYVNTYNEEDDPTIDERIDEMIMERLEREEELKEGEE